MELKLMYNEVIELLAITETINEVGDRIESITKKEVFAQLRSVGMKETYEAMNAGLKPEKVFVLADYYDYNDQEFIEYENERYTVLRTYRKNSNELEIVVTR
jgi:SPP1 family predicted phage head-tail adaptor